MPIAEHTRLIWADNDLLRKDKKVVSLCSAIRTTTAASSPAKIRGKELAGGPPIISIEFISHK